MAHRHKVHKAKGGHVESREEHDREIGRTEGHLKKHGGRAKHASGGKVSGFKSGGRLDKRARGGGVGSDKHPFSSAHVGHKRGGHAHHSG